MNLKNNLADDRSLSHNSINCVYCDDVGIVWIGTYKKGVSYYSESTFKFGVEHLHLCKIVVILRVILRILRRMEKVIYGLAPMEVDLFR